MTERHTRRRRIQFGPHTAFLALFLCALLWCSIYAVWEAVKPDVTSPEASTPALTAPLDTGTPAETVPPATETDAAPMQDMDWRLTLVNSIHPIPTDWEVTLKELRNGFYVDERIYPDLQQMFDDARAAGLEPLIVSAYRTEEKQTSIFENRVTEYMDEGYDEETARELTSQWVAVPGYSEHQLGLAVDINAESGDIDEVYDWLLENCQNYGFILRYPPDKVDITGISNEPWHFRYVGVEAAREIMGRGLCLEEYLGEAE